ncbi:probable cytochrome P450 313a4 [Ochlerotatus camptorhynchus]|uniref:probable cytochrome P450 313a4 n=1 Tax=Ochlerotatus camptorhynchus TaxID=644619 RepID=UPI0031D9D372
MLWDSLLVYICASVLTVFIYFQWTRRKMYASLASMSGPTRLPLIGHAHKFVNVSPETIADTLIYFVSNFPSPVCIHMGPLPHVAVFDPEQVQAVLYSPNCLDKSLHYSFFRIPRTLLTAPGHLWKGLRKTLNPALGPTILNSFIPIFNQKSALLAELLEQHVGKPERNFERDVAKCTLDQIYLTAFGCDHRMQQSPEGDISLELFDIYMEIMVARMFTIWKYPEFIYRMTKAYRIERESRKTYLKMNSKLLHAFNLGEQFHKSNDDNGTSKPKNVLECLKKYICEVNPAAKDDIPHHIVMILFAGNDTTAKTVSFILLMLAMHPDVQDRCFQEIMQVCTGEDGFVSAEDVANLTYLDMVCKETMRLYPVGPMLARVTTGEVKLNDQHIIPANCNIIIGIYQIHRDPKIWGQNADKFDPDNFLPDNVTKRHPYSFIPFSGGPRNCMGMRYAVLSMKITIVHMLRKYRLKTSLTIDQLKVSYGIMLNIANGCQLTIEKR